VTWRAPLAGQPPAVVSYTINVRQYDQITRRSSAIATTLAALAPDVHRHASRYYVACCEHIAQVGEGVKPKRRVYWCSVRLRPDATSGDFDHRLELERLDVANMSRRRARQDRSVETSPQAVALAASV
jgi:hypothetical protein